MPRVVIEYWPILIPRRPLLEWINVLPFPIVLPNILPVFYSADNPDLKAGVISLARMLSLPEHDDHFVLLQVQPTDCLKQGALQHCHVIKDTPTH